jgi:acyl-CoA thioester hydrolase
VRKVAPFPLDIQARIADVLASHAAIARPEGIGRRVAMPGT